MMVEVDPDHQFEPSQYPHDSCTVCGVGFVYHADAMWRLRSLMARSRAERLADGVSDYLERNGITLQQLILVFVLAFLAAFVAGSFAGLAWPQRGPSWVFDP